MKILRYTAAAIALIALNGMNSYSQDAPPCADCIISGVLDRLPTDDGALFQEMMAELATVPGESVMAIASMLEPPDGDSNYIYETALEGLVAYASLPGRRALASTLRRALSGAAAACPDPDNRAYLSSLAASLRSRPRR